jgi:hypothetical protein
MEDAVHITKESLRNPEVPATRPPQPPRIMTQENSQNLK